MKYSTSWCLEGKRKGSRESIQQNPTNQVINGKVTLNTSAPSSFRYKAHTVQISSFKVYIWFNSFQCIQRGNPENNQNKMNKVGKSTNAQNSFKFLKQKTKNWGIYQKIIAINFNSKSQQKIRRETWEEEVIGSGIIPCCLL